MLSLQFCKTPNFNLNLISRKGSIPPKFSISSKHSTRPVYIPNRIPHPSYVRVLDTTLRDGEQTLGVNFTLDQKINIAYQLARMGVDVIEAGFPATSPEAVEVAKTIALAIGTTSGGHINTPVINVLSRCVRTDIDASWEAVRRADHPRVTLFIPTSEIHMKHKLRMNKAQVLAQVKDAMVYARGLGFEDIAFGCEDASRSEKEFMYVVVEEAIKGGATTVVLADTVGYMLPNEWAHLIEGVRKNVKGIENVIISTHCHDDLGLATANTLAAVAAGARQVEVTVNGIGERAGNAPLEEFVMALKCRGDDVLGGLHTGINAELIGSTSDMVERYSGLAVQPNKAIVGSNAFSHAAGIHQDGVLKHRSTYEILSPQDIGRLRSNDLGVALGKHSGRHGLQFRLDQLGYNLESKKFDTVFAHFKAMSQNKKYFSDEDIRLLVAQSI